MSSIAGNITEKEIATLVDRFYDGIRADERLGPLFDAAIEDWDQHLQIMRDFWSAALLRTSRYHGCVMSAHFRLPIAAEDFDRWLLLFRPAAAETLTPAAAEEALTIAEGITMMLRQSMAEMRRTKSGEQQDRR